MKVLLIEGDQAIGELLVEALKAGGHRPLWRRSGVDALAMHAGADLLLLDLDLPDIEGLDVLRRLRRVSAMPVLVLAQRNDERSVVLALRSGADDYLVKPPRPHELLARLEAVARRAGGPRTEPGGVVEVDDMAVDLGARIVRVHDDPVHLTAKQFDVLAVLARSVGTAVSRRRIADEVWGAPHIKVSRSLDVHMTALRAKLARPAALRTIRGFGYQLG
jgi:DNA-binding response OmpR family regulator